MVLNSLSSKEMDIAIQQDNALSEFTHRVQNLLNAKL
jgi:hypothetical protein